MCYTDLIMAHKEAITAEAYTYTILIELAEEGGYVVTVPRLPGCVTQGETLEEARAMAADAIEGYLESLYAHGDSIPPSELHAEEPIREEITVTLKTV